MQNGQFRIKKNKINFLAFLQFSKKNCLSYDIDAITISFPVLADVIQDMSYDQNNYCTALKYEILYMCLQPLFCVYNCNIVILILDQLFQHCQCSGCFQFVSFNKRLVTLNCKYALSIATIQYQIDGRFLLQY